ncbi:hypothetical protein [Streptomyces rimosus]|uniref:hypothetical protein n=1 Tax=Streptomyces rimosus TaxID=1927 RepID=UPI0004C7BDB6|nr:hypothetical protein [Streptomyces rimosus]
MRLAHTIVDTLIFVIHAVALGLALWIFGSSLPGPVMVLLICLTAAADLAATVPLGRLANTIRANTRL